MTKRPSLRELLAVWLVGAVGEAFAYDVVEGAEAALTATVVASGFVFFVTPLFLVVYSLLWAWPLAAMGDRTAVLTTLVMRLLAVLIPVAFAACAGSAAWSYRRRAEPARR